MHQTMTKKYKKPGIIIATIVLVSILLSFILNMVLEQKISKAIANLPDSVLVDYKSIDTNIWLGNIEVTMPKIEVKGKNTNEIILDAKTKTIELNDLSYWEFLVNDKIDINQIFVNQLIANYKHNSVVKNDSYQASFIENIKQVIGVNEILINDSNVLISDYKTDSIIVSVPVLKINLNDLELNPHVEGLKNQIKYSDFSLVANDLMYAISDFEILTASLFKFSNNSIDIESLSIKTKYGKTEYSRILKTERDHFDLSIKEIDFVGLDYGFNENDAFYLISDHIKLNTPEAEIYRDKLVADGITHKPLYASILRDLDFQLDLKQINIDNGKISYLEKVNMENPAGRLDFSNMEVILTNVSNINANQPTEIEINTTFMENSILKVDWNFVVANESDEFEFKADLGVFEVNQLDQFSKSNLNVDLNGALAQTYFTISGNKESSRVNLKMKYDDFEVVILKKNGKERNKFLSSLVNLIVKDNSRDEGSIYRYGLDEAVERDKTKSVFNFVWLNVRQGLLDAMTGDGTKEN